MQGPLPPDQETQRCKDYRPTQIEHDLKDAARAALLPEDPRSIQERKQRQARQS